jgi:segregation and condensation protein B
MSPDHVKNVVEAAIFAANEPLGIERLLALFEDSERPEKETLSAVLQQLADEYAPRPIELKEVANGYRFQVKTEVAPWVSRLWDEKPHKYSRALLETLALIAYRQPITRGEIEEIRGVAVSTQIVKTLQEREWIRVVGHRDVPGRPSLYATTKNFLDYFGLKNLDELPPLSQLKDIDALDIAAGENLISEMNESSRVDDLADAILQMDAAENARETPTPVVETATSTENDALAEAISEIENITDIVELDDVDFGEGLNISAASNDNGVDEGGEEWRQNVEDETDVALDKATAEES